MDIREKTILGFTGGAHFFTHFYMLIFPALLLPMSRDLDITIAVAVDLSFVMYLLYGLMAAPWGFMSDRWSHKGALAIGIGTAGLGMFLAGLSAFLGAGKGYMTASFALTGIGCSAFHPAGTALISQGIRERGRALGINGVFGNIGIAAAPITAGILNYALGWQMTLIILGGLGVLLGIGSSLAPIGIEGGTDKLTVDTVERGSAVRLFLIFAVGMMFSGLMYRAFTTILPAFLELRLGNISRLLREAVGTVGSGTADAAAGSGGAAAAAGPGTTAAGPDNPALDTFIANAVTTGVYVIGIIGQLIGGRVADRRSLKWGYFAFFAIALPFAAGMIFLDGLFLIPAAGLFVLFILGIQPIENSLVAYLTPPKWRSVSYGIKFSLVFGVGALAVKLVSWIQEKTGSLNNVVWIIPLFLVGILAAFSIFLILSRGKKIQHLQD